MTRLCLLLISLSMVVSPPTRAGSISTSDIISKTADATFSCMQWTPVGLCFWLRCSYFECDVESSVKIGHYNPDFVVSAYNELGHNPWQEIRSVLGEAQQSAAEGILGSLSELPIDSAGNRTEGSSDNREHKNLLFRETDLIGHPLQVFSGSTPETLCASQAEPFRPYFQSGLDARSWRYAIPEALYAASVTPGLRELGDWPVQTWGGVFPRTGWTTQAEEPKAAALNAQRAGDIVTRARQPHVYLSLDEPSETEQKVWPPDPLRETDHRTGTWQMLLPVTDTECAVFGINDLTDESGWGGGRVDEEGDYVWNLWRPYQCCEREGQLFLFDIDWIEYPE